MTRTHGWWRHGALLKAHAPHGHWRTITFIAALRSGAISAPCLFDGSIIGESFLVYVRQALVPTLRPGDIVVMYNIGSHKARTVKMAIREAAARLWFLPAYSPDLNPIEQVFAKLKTLLRKAEERTIDAVRERIGKLLTAFTPRVRQLLPQQRPSFSLSRKGSSAASLLCIAPAQLEVAIVCGTPR